MPVRLALGLLVLAGVAAGGWAGQAVPMAVQWTIFDGLRTTAAIVFTVVGIWIALIYPDVLQNISAWRQGRTQQTPRLSRLFEPLVESAFIVGVVTFIALVKPLAGQLRLVPEATTAIRAVSFGLLVALTLLQLRSLLASISPFMTVLQRVGIEEQLARTRSRFSEPRSSGPQREPAVSRRERQE
jgi:hypothetical protein